MQCVAAVLVITRRQTMLVASEPPLAIFCEPFAAATLNPTANLLCPSIKTLTKCAVADRVIDLRLNKPALLEIRQVRCYGTLAIVGAARGGKDVAPRFHLPDTVRGCSTKRIELKRRHIPLFTFLPYVVDALAGIGS